jgi:hypothetical protein
MLLSICPISSAIVLTVLFSRGRRDRVHMDLQLPMQLVPITTKVVSSNQATNLIVNLFNVLIFDQITASVVYWIACPL